MEQAMTIYSHTPESYLRAAYLDLAYTLSQFDDNQLKDAGITPKLRDAIEGYLVAYVVASVDTRRVELGQ